MRHGPTGVLRDVVARSHGVTRALASALQIPQHLRSGALWSAAATAWTWAASDFSSYSDNPDLYPSNAVVASTNTRQATRHSPQEQNKNMPAHLSLLLSFVDCDS